MNFGQALEHLKNGSEVSRQGWDNKGLRLELQVPDEGSNAVSPCIVLQSPYSRAYWVASQKDILADDWELWKRPILYWNELWDGELGIMLAKCGLERSVASIFLSSVQEHKLCVHIYPEATLDLFDEKFVPRKWNKFSIEYQKVERPKDQRQF